MRKSIHLKLHTIIMKQYLIGQNLYGFCSISMQKRRHGMGKILIAILGVIAVAIEEITKED